MSQLLKHNKKPHYSFVIAFITFLILLAASGVRAAPGVLIVPLECYFNWNRAQISLSVSISLLLYGACGPFAAALMEMYGLRKIMSMALLILSVGIGLTVFMKAPWHMHLLWGVAAGIGTGFLSPVLGTVVANRWFYKNRGMVVGFFSAGGAAGQLILLPLFSNIAVFYSWQTVIIIIACISLTCMILTLLFIRDKPSDMGLLPYGAKKTDIIEESDGQNPFYLAFEGLKIALSKKEFYLLTGSFFVCGSTANGLIGTHFIPACVDSGIKEVVAAGMLSAAGLFSLIGTAVSGWLSDRVDNRWLLFWYYILRALSLFLFSFSFGSNQLSLIVFIVFYGLEWAATLPPTVKLSNTLFGKHSGIVFGWMMVIHQIGAALAAFLGGAVHTYVGSYYMSFISGSVLCIIAAGLVINLKVGSK